MGRKLLETVEKEVEEEKERGETGMYFSSGHHQWDAHHPPPQPGPKTIEDLRAEQEKINKE